MKRAYLILLFIILVIIEGFSAFTIGEVTPATGGECNGSVEVIATGDSGPFIVSITDSQGNTQTATFNGSHIFSGICEGTVQVSIEYESGCGANISTNIPELTQNPECEEITISSPNIYNASGCEADGVISWLQPDINGGTPPYSYSWSNGGTQLYQSNLSPGTYTLIITDSEGCESTFSYEIEGLGFPEIIYEVSEPSCEGEMNGYIGILVDVNISSPLSFQWSNGQSSSSNDVSELYNLDPGDYCVTITVEDSGCTSSSCYTVEERESEGPFVLYVDDISDLICPDAQDGFINVSAQGGTPPYLFVWDNGSGGASLSNVSAGSYTVTATDDCDREITGTYEMGSHPEMSISLETTAGCPNQGGIEAIVSGGVPPYSYSWSSSSSDASVSNLNDGTYGVTVEDANGCTISSSTDLTNINAELTDIMEPCVGINNGSVTISVQNPDAEEVNIQIGGTIVFSSTDTEINYEVNNLSAPNVIYEYQVEIVDNCIIPIPIHLDAEFTDLEYSHYDVKAGCVFDEYCEGNLVGEGTHFSNVKYDYGDAAGAFLEPCGVIGYCAGDEAVTGRFGDKIWTRGYTYLLILGSASSSGYYSDAYINELNERFNDKFTYCSRVKFCPVTLKISSSSSAFNDYSDQIEFLDDGCRKIYCDFPSLDFTICADDEIFDEIDPGIVEGIVDCDLKQRNLYQMIVWHNALQGGFGNYGPSSENPDGSELYLYIEEILNNPILLSKAVCANVRFCKSDFSFLYSDVEDVDCPQFSQDDCILGDIVIDDVAFLPCESIPEDVNNPIDIYFCPEECEFEIEGCTGTSWCENYQIVNSEFDGTLFTGGGDGVFSSYVVNGNEDENFVNLMYIESDNYTMPMATYETTTNNYIYNFTPNSRIIEKTKSEGIGFYKEFIETNESIYSLNIDERKAEINYENEFSNWRVDIHSDIDMEIQEMFKEDNFLYVVGTSLGSFEIGTFYKQSIAPTELCLFIAKFDTDGNFLSTNTIKNSKQDIVISSNRNGTFLIGGHYENNSLIIDGEQYPMENTEGIFVVMLDSNEDIQIIKDLELNIEAEILDLEYSYDMTNYSLIVSNVTSISDELNYNFQIGKPVTLILSFNDKNVLNWDKYTRSKDIHEDNVSITYGLENKLFAGVSFTKSIDFSGLQFNSQGETDIVLMGIDNSGNYFWSEQYGTVEQEIVTDLFFDIGSNLLYFAGEYAEYNENRIIGKYQFHLQEGDNLQRMYLSFVEIDLTKYKLHNGEKSNDNPSVNTKDVSIESNNLGEIKVYPNPVKNTLTIDVLDEIINFPINLEIINSTGKIIRSQEIDSQTIQISTEDFSTGLYILKFRTPNGVVSKKVIKI